MGNHRDTRCSCACGGAGFSRNAVLPAPNSPKPPLWTDFCRIMKEHLYPGLREKDTTTDPLRLAEEYKAALGPAALESLIYELVRDKEWRSGPLFTANLCACQDGYLPQDPRIPLRTALKCTSGLDSREPRPELASSKRRA